MLLKITIFGLLFSSMISEITAQWGSDPWMNWNARRNWWNYNNQPWSMGPWGPDRNYWGGNQWQGNPNGNWRRGWHKKHSSSSSSSSSQQQDDTWHRRDHPRGPERKTTTTTTEQTPPGPPGI